MGVDYSVAVFGLGSMGFGMAKSCLSAGLVTFGQDVVQAQTARFVSQGGRSLEDNAALKDLNAAVIVVLNADQTEHVLFGPDGICAKLSPGAVVVACATLPPQRARDFEQRCNALSVHYLDAPISGAFDHGIGHASGL